MAFLKKATLNIKSVYAADNDGKFQWRDFVKQANETPSNDRTKFLPPEAYNFDTKNFLFLTARAISGMEKHGYNGNYDAFPWEEIKKALPTYPGVGFYIEHKEDSEADAKGIVLDAIPNEEENFVVCLCAIDKNEYPEFVQQILDGTYNQVSMSCLASTCECSKCHNVATSFDNLCEHMNVNNPITYCKGKVDENGNVVYEINRDLCFTGLSAVEVPADKDAFVFDIKASKNKQNKLKEEFNKYMAIKQAGKMKEFKMACEEQFKAMSNVDLLNKMKTLADTITTTIMGSNNADIITSPLQGIVKELMQLQIGLNMMDLQKLDNSTIEPAKEESGQEPLTMIEDDAESFGEEVNLDKEINSMLKKAEEVDQQLNKALENPFDAHDLLMDKTITKEDGELFTNAVNKALDLSSSPFDFLADKIVTKDDGELYTKVSNKALENTDYAYWLLRNKVITKDDGEVFIKAVNKAIKYRDDYEEELLENGIISKKDLEKFKNKLNVKNLDKEIDSYLDGDNYSYTPFSSTASLNKIIEKTYRR